MVVYYKNMVLEGCPEEIVEMIKLYEHGFPTENNPYETCLPNLK
jgi:hypothetical protein